MLPEESKSRIAELDDLAIWLKTTQMCSEDRLLMQYHILNRVNYITAHTKKSEDTFNRIFGIGEKC